MVIVMVIAIVDGRDIGHSITPMIIIQQITQTIDILMLMVVIMVIHI